MGPVRFALPLSRVSETLRPLPLSRLQNGATFECGEATIRGQATPVYDVGLLLGATRATHGRWVTLKTHPRPVALAVDAVLGVEALDELRTAGPLLSMVSPELTSEPRAVLLEARRVRAETAR